MGAFLFFFALLSVCAATIVFDGNPLSATCDRDTRSEQVAGRCSFYTYCRGGNRIIKKCSFGKMFNNTTHSCQWFWKVNCKDTNPECNDGDLYRNPESNGAYFSCLNGKLRLEFCPFLTCFNGNGCTHDACNDRTSAFLKSGMFPSSITADISSKDEITLEQKKCKNGSKRPVPDCRKFEVCQNGKFKEKECPSDQAYDSVSASCKFEWEAECDENSCLEGYKYPDKADCKKYFLCVNYKRVSQSCGWLRDFDPVKKECLWRFNVDCKAKLCKEGETRKISGKGKYEECEQGEWKKKSCTNGEFNPSRGKCSCKNNTRIAIKGNPKYYLECQGGDWVTQECLLKDYYFSESSQMCEKQLKKGLEADLQLVSMADLSEACQNKAVKYNPGFCSTYLKCQNHKWAVKKCPKGLMFQGKTCEDKPCKYEPVPNFCDQYKDGDEIATCPAGYRFDSETRECVTFSEAHCKITNCKGVEKKNHPYDCSKYLECVDETFVERDCGFLHWFDMPSRTCKMFGAQCRYDPASCNEGEMHPVPESCRDYKICKDDTYQLGSCWLKEFDSVTEKCVWWGANCATNIEIFSLAETCKNGEKRHVENTCRIYEECEKNKWVTKSCSPCQNFNIDEKICDYVWKKPCEKGTTDPSSLPTEPPTPSTPPACPEGIKQAIVGDCSHYLQCEDGIWTNEKCSLWGKFDSVSLECFLWTAWKAKCA